MEIAWDDAEPQKTAIFSMWMADYIVMDKLRKAAINLRLQLPNHPELAAPLLSTWYSAYQILRPKTEGPERTRGDELFKNMGKEIVLQEKRSVRASMRGQKTKTSRELYRMFLDLENWVYDLRERKGLGFPTKKIFSQKERIKRAVGVEDGKKDS